MLNRLHDLLDHLIWADRKLYDAIPWRDAPAREIRLEFAHIIGAEETWLARLEERPAQTGVWPDLDSEELKSQMLSTHTAYRTYLGELNQKKVAKAINYLNSAGNPFATTVEEILFHVALHGQYHRGKVNLMLRQGGWEPAPVDYIAWLRGAPAATNT